jgi:hypothetical protein
MSLSDSKPFITDLWRAHEIETDAERGREGERDRGREGERERGREGKKKFITDFLDIFNFFIGTHPTFNEKENEEKAMYILITNFKN